ncbi:MFS transporter [Enterococcus sp. AZ050]|uniref:MFS transporter n=1 Tax=Enterococcus sp. AZ050 TaxID=2774696 RepID=UPI003F29280A
MFIKTNQLNDKNVHLINLNRILRALILLWPVMTLIYLSKGLSFFEIGLLNSVGSIVIAVLEVPSGLLADKFGRKKNLIIGNFLNILFVLLLYISQHFYGLLLAEIVFSVASCLISGTDASLLYDSLKQKNLEKEYAKVVAKNRSITIFLSIFTVILATFLLEKYTWLLFLSSFLLYLTMFGATMFLTEMKNLSENEEEADTKKAKPSFLTAFKKNQLFLFLALFSSVIILLVSNLSVLASPILIENGMKLKHTGYVMAGAKILSIILLRNQSRILKLLQKNVLKRLTTLLFVSTTLTLVINSSYYWIYLICLVLAVNNFLQPLISEKMNQLISSKNRTTMLSISNMLDNVLFFGGDPALGFSIDKVGYNRTFGSFGILLCLGFPLYAFVKPKLFKEK